MHLTLWWWYRRWLWCQFERCCLTVCLTGGGADAVSLVVSTSQVCLSVYPTTASYVACLCFLVHHDIITLWCNQKTKKRARQGNLPGPGTLVCVSPTQILMSPAFASLLASPSLQSNFTCIFQFTTYFAVQKYDCQLKKSGWRKREICRNIRLPRLYSPRSGWNLQKISGHIGLLKLPRDI